MDKRKHIQHKILSLVFVLFLLTAIIWHLVTPDSDFSETEKRPLETFTLPEIKNLVSGRFMTSFERYADDQFPLRPFFVGLKSASEKVIGKFDNGRVWFGNDGYLIEKKTTPPDLSTHANHLFEFGVKLNKQSPETKRYLMIAPTASSMIPDVLPPFTPAIDQEAILADFYRRAGDYHVIDLKDALSTDEAHRFFYRNDHHWTTEGAKVAYENFCFAAGLEPVQDLQTSEISDRFLGTTYAKAALFSPRPDTISIYRPAEGDDPNEKVRIIDDKGSLLRTGIYAWEQLESADPYLVFMGENAGYLKLQTSADTGRSLLLIKDSYANAVIPFLTHHYETIHVIDLRYFTGDLMTLMKDERPIQDTLILYNFVTFSEDKNLYRLLR
ncbi:MAG TPA: hypothetical protein GXZ89_00205 [Fastidiosipila sp.]|nr:hypothetical protein [Fastidiosipila sp.]